MARGLRKWLAATELVILPRVVFHLPGSGRRRPVAERRVRSLDVCSKRATVFCAPAREFENTALLRSPRILPCLSRQLTDQTQLLIPTLRVGQAKNAFVFRGTHSRSRSRSLWYLRQKHAVQLRNATERCYLADYATGQRHLGPYGLFCIKPCEPSRSPSRCATADP